MVLHGLLRKISQLIAIQLGGPRIVLLLGVSRVAVMLPEELGCIGIAAQLHVPQLKPGPVRVEIRRSHESYVHAQITMHC